MGASMSWCKAAPGGYSWGEQARRPPGGTHNRGAPALGVGGSGQPSAPTPFREPSLY